MPRLIPQDRSVKKLFFVALVPIALGIIFLALAWQQLPPLVPLFYSHPWGTSQLAGSMLLALPIALACTLLFINSLLAQTASSAFLKKTLVVGAIVICILASITTLRIVLLII